jgi:isopenicillin-N epimerase
MVARLDQMSEAAPGRQPSDTSGSAVRGLFLLDPDVCFLNHGSYGATPRPVFDAYQEWQRELERQPVQFLSRRLDDLLMRARGPLAAFVGARPQDLAFVQNATTGVNVIARSLRLAPGDEVLATDLEYGACDLTWEHWCRRSGSHYLRKPIDLANPVGSLFAAAGDRTRAVFVSHVTSSTALVLPVADICEEAHRRGLIAVVDGAHAPAQVALDLGALGADIYTGNCHKWLCAPKGSGFIWASQDHQEWLEAPIVSWGWEGGGDFLSRIEKQGTRDPAAYLATPAAIAFVSEHDEPKLCHDLAVVARREIARVLGVEPTAPDEHYVGRMAAVPLAAGVDGDALQRRLYEEDRIEVPIVNGLLRVSFAMYNDRSDLDRLLTALQRILAGGTRPST